MAASIAQAAEEFLELNQRYAAGGLDDDTHVLWSSLARRLEGAVVTRQSHGHEDGPRRQHARARLGLTVRFGQPAELGESRTLDVSAGGCAVEVAAALRRGTEVEVALSLPHELGGVTAGGWVSWCRPGGRPGRWRAGLTFAALTQRERDLLSCCVLGETIPTLALAS
jgi:hypothetical protein